MANFMIQNTHVHKDKAFYYDIFKIYTRHLSVKFVNKANGVSKI